MPRKEFSRKVKREAYERSQGACEGLRCDGCGKFHVRGTTDDCMACGSELSRCNAPIDTGRFVYDHCDPDWYSKDNELENCEVLCFPCDAEKTPRDQADIAKSKRIQDKKIKALKSRRGFKSWRKFNGQVIFASDRRR